MLDFRELIQVLQANLPDTRRAMSPEEWNAFKQRLAAAVPPLQAAGEDADARLEAIAQLEDACLDFPAARRTPARYGSRLPEPKPAQEPRSEPIVQRPLDIKEWIEAALELCRNPDAVADQIEAAKLQQPDA